MKPFFQGFGVVIVALVFLWLGGVVVISPVSVGSQEIGGELVGVPGEVEGGVELGVWADQACDPVSLKMHALEGRINHLQTELMDLKLQQNARWKDDGYPGHAGPSE